MDEITNINWGGKGRKKSQEIRYIQWAFKFTSPVGINNLINSASFFFLAPKCNRQILKNKILKFMSSCVWNNHHYIIKNIKWYQCKHFVSICICMCILTPLFTILNYWWNLYAAMFFFLLFHFQIPFEGRVRIPAVKDFQHHLAFWLTWAPSDKAVQFER